MKTKKVLNGKSYAGNPRVRFDEGDVASAATPRRGSLLYKTVSNRVRCIKAAALLAAIGGTVFTQSANAAAETHEINGVNWTFCERNDSALTITLGANDANTDASISNPAKAIDPSLSIDVADIPWKVTIDDKVYTVTKIGRYAFNWCTNLTGTLTIPDEVIRIGRAAFANSGLKSIATLGGVETLDGYAFQNTGSAANPFPDLSNVKAYTMSGSGNGINHVFESARYSGAVYLHSGSTTLPGRYSFKDCVNLTGVCCIGPATVESGTQTYETFGRYGTFNGATSLKVVFVGLNTKAGSSSIAWLNGVTGCKVIVPDNGYWSTPNVGANNEAIYYGGSTGLGIDADNDAKNVAISVANASALEKALEIAPLFNEVFGWEVRIVVPSGIDMSGGAVAGGLFAANKLPAVFAVKTQAQLEKVLAAVPSTSLLAIDPTGATESLTMPQDRAVWVYLAGNGQYRKIKGMVIIVR